MQVISKNSLSIFQESNYPAGAVPEPFIGPEPWSSVGNGSGPLTVPEATTGVEPERSAGAMPASFACTVPGSFTGVEPVDDGLSKLARLC